jgi:hypothetical protein
MNAPVQIRKPEVAERLRRISQREGRSITDVIDALSLKAEQEHEAEVQRKIACAEEIIAHFQSLPIVGPLLTDDDLYDEDGLPK